jgi:hypothetical protein
MRYSHGRHLFTLYLLCTCAERYIFFLHMSSIYALVCKQNYRPVTFKFCKAEFHRNCVVIYGFYYDM